MSSSEPGWLSSSVLDPKGPVGLAEHQILLNATVIMLAVIVPVIMLTLEFAKNGGLAIGER